MTPENKKITSTSIDFNILEGGDFGDYRLQACLVALLQTTCGTRSMIIPS